MAIAHVGPPRARVAVVEDDPAILALIQELLESEGYVCLIASSAKAGLELAQQERPDLLIVDVVLGSAHAGWKLLDQLGSDPYTAALPVIIRTADAASLRDHEAVLRERGIRCLSKPFDLAELLELVEQACSDSRRARRSTEN